MKTLIEQFDFDTRSPPTVNKLPQQSRKKHEDSQHSTTDSSSLHSPIECTEDDSNREFLLRSHYSPERFSESKIAQSQQKKALFQAFTDATDRFIPNRKHSKLEIAFSSVHEVQDMQKENKQTEITLEESSITVADIFKAHVLGINQSRLVKMQELQPYQNKNLLRFKQLESNRLPLNCPRPFAICQDDDAHKLHLVQRKIPRVPYKVLDAPALQDDFYLNLIDWSQCVNVLGVGLSSCVYLWNSQNSKVTKLCDMGMSDAVSSLQFCPKNAHLAVGTNTGETQIWDVAKLKKIRVFQGHQSRVGCISWGGQLLTTGSRDKTILHRDIRMQTNYVMKLYQAHKQEVCGLKWSFDDQSLASGGNDNKLFVWNAHSQTPLCKFSNHTAAVKALAWSPHQHGLLVSGGGTADRSIRFWNTQTSQQLSYIDTGSQVCNLIFSKNVNELVSTQGYSLNHIIVWSYPQMEKLAILTGHTYRVLYLAMNPEGDTIVTGAGDETLRFWSVFPSSPQQSSETQSSLLLEKNNQIR